jgi:tape measure domain-containing protein
MAIRDTSIRLRLDDSEAQSRVKKLQAQLNGIDRKKYKVNLDIDDKKLKRTVASLNQLKNVKFGSNADALTSQFSRLETVSKRFQEQLSRGAKGSVLLGTSNQIDNITSKIQKLNQQQVGDLFKNAGSSIASLRSGVDSVADSIGSLIKRGTVLAAGLTVALGAVAKSTLNLAGQQQLAFNDTVILLGDNEQAARKLAKQLNEFDVKSPFNISQLNQLANVMAVSIPDADKLAIKVKELADVSGGSFEKASRAAITLQQVFSKGFLDTRDFRELTTSAPALAKELQKFGAGTKEGLKVPLDQVDQALANVTDGFKRTETAARSLPGLLSSVQSIAQRLGLAFLGIDLSQGFDIKAGGLFDKISQAVSGIVDNPNLLKSATNFGFKISEAISGALGNIDTTKVSGNLVNFFNKAADVAPKAINTIVTEFKRIKSELAPVISFATKAIGGFLDKLGGGDKVKGAIVLIESLVKSFIALKVASPILGGLSKSLGLIGTIMQGGNLSGLLGFVQGFAKAGTSGFAGLASGFAGIAGALGSALPVILAVAAAVGVLFLAIRKISQSELLKSIFAALIKPLVNAFKMLWESLKQAYQAIKPIIDIFGKAIAWQGIVTLVVVVGSLAASLTALAIVLKVIVDLFRLQVAVVKAAGQSIGAFLMLLKTGNVNQFVSSMKGINSEFKNTVTGIGNSYKQFFSGFKTDANSAKTSADALKTAIDGIKGAIDTLSGASLNVENLKIQFAEAVKASQDALAAAGGDTSNSAYRQAKINEFQVQQQLNEAIQQEKDLKSQLSAQYDDLISKSSQGVAISQQEKDAILEKLKLYKTQQEALGLNTAELDKMITNIEKINATPANAQTTTNAPETQEKQEGVLIKQDEINNKPAEARVTANDQASGPLDNILGKLQQIVSRVWNTTVNVAASGIDGIRNRIEGLINRANRATGTLIQASGGIVPQYRQSGGLIYAAKGYVHPGNPRGSDIVPAWLSPGEGVVRRSSMASLGKNMFNEINRRGGDAIRDVFNKGFQAGNTYNNKTANTTVNITNNNPGSAMSSIMGLDRRINNGIA